MPTRDDRPATLQAPPPPPSAVAASAVHPLDPILLAGSINLLAGTSGVGKTALLALLARLLSKHLPIFGTDPPPQPPFQAYIGVNKSWVHSSAKWFALEGVSLPHYSLADDRLFKKRRMRNKTDRIAILAECLAKVAPDALKFPPGSLVYVDSLSLFLGGNLLDYDASAVACMEVRELCQQMGDVALVGTVDAAKIKSDKKQGYARLQDHILGSAALYGYTDTQLFLASPAELKSKTYTFLWAPHHAKEETFHLGRDDRGCFLSERLHEAHEASWIVDVLKAAPEHALSFVELFKEALERNISKSKMQRQLDREIDAGRVRKVGHGKYGLAGKH